MNFVEIATVGKPHGFRGAFVAVTDAGRDSTLGSLDTIFIGPSPDRLTEHSILEAAWMPKGWKLAVSDIQSDTQVKGLRGQKLFAPRQDMPEPEAGEFYVGDLVGCDVLEDEKVVGTFAGVEFGERGTGDRWWVDSPRGRYGLPANGHFIVKVDAKARRIHVKNLAEITV